MIKNIKIFLLLAIFSASCTDLDSPQPINSIATQFAFADKESVGAALNGVYSDLQDATLAFDGWLALPQYFSDETVFTGTFPTRLEFGNFNVFPANTTMAVVYSDLYEVINRANNVIANVPLVEDDSFTDEARQDAIAQARFVRGHVYFHLVTLWQEVPLITQPTVDVGEVLEVPVSSVDAIYTQVIDDFTFAQANVTAATGPLFASQQAATAFLARVALYQERWNDAVSLSMEALGGVDLTTVAYLADQIYSLGFTPTDGNSIAFFYGPAEFGGRHSIEPSATLMNAYEDGDARAAMSFVNDTLQASVPFGIKYPSFDNANSGSATDPIFFIRHAELALIAAEGMARNGDFGGASGMINAVRNRAGLGDVTLDGGNFVDLILQERFVELAMEGPHRLLDLRRTGNAVSVLGALGYDANCDDIWPLPQRDVDRNRNLDQNDCCNC
jgi:hypothetical protein